MLEDLNQFSFISSEVNFQISQTHNVPMSYVLYYVPHVTIIPKWFLFSHLCIDVEYNLFYHYDD